MKRKFFLTDMPVWLVLVLTLIMLPRTILNDIGVLEESSLAYRIVALTPFAVWLVVAIWRKSKKPFMDFLVLGVLFGLSLAAVHQMLWSVASSLGHHPPTAAISFAEQFPADVKELVIRGYTVMVSLVIGVGSGVVIGGIAVLARLVRSRRQSK